jgi:hypothetical protein
MVLLYAPGFSGEQPVAPKWTSCQHTWVAWDGSEWDLSHGASGIKLMAGTRGLMDAPIIRYSSKAPAVAGSLWRGSVTDEREAFWPLKVFSDAGSDEWILHNQRFWNTLDPDQTGKWVVTWPSGVRRVLTLRYTGLAEDSDDTDPSLIGWRIYGIQMVAENPYWMGEPITRTFDNKPGENFYGGTGGGGFGPPFFLSSGTLLERASITNLGDVPVWPTWTVQGPCTTATVNGVTFPMTLDDGEWVTINTDPTDQVAYDNTGDDRTSELVNFYRFAEIPRGVSVPLTVSMTGLGSVVVSITPAYRRAM